MENENYIIDFYTMSTNEKLNFLSEHGGYLEDERGLNENGHDIIDDNGQCLIIEKE